MDITLNDFVSKLQAKRAEQSSKKAQAVQHTESLVTSVATGNRIIDAVKSSEPKVEVKNQISTDSLAKSDDIKSAVDSINALTLTTFLSSKDSWMNLVGDLASLSEQLTNAVAQIKQDGVVRIENSLQTAVTSLEATVKALKNVEVSTDREHVNATKALTEALSKVNFKPTLKIPEPKVILQEKEVNFSGVIEALQSIRDDLSVATTVVPELDTTAIVDGLSGVENKIQDLINKPVPVPEFPTTIKISNQAGQDILDPTAGYAPSDIDESGDPKYYGFLASDGRWYIMRNTGDTTYRYVVGSSGYATAWTNRASQTYDYFSEVF